MRCFCESHKQQQSYEWINRVPRYCLWLVGISPSNLRGLPLVSQRVAKCKKAREESPDAGRRRLADNDKLLMVVMTNNNSFVIPDLDVQAIFYKEGQMIGSDKDGHDVVLPGHSVASRLDIPEGSDEYDVSISVDWHYATGYRNWTDQVSVESNKGERCVMISFTNNGDVDIQELEYVVALYKNGKFVDITHPRDVYDFYSGSTIVEKADTYSTDFDDYKIFINQAHTF